MSDDGRTDRQWGSGRAMPQAVLLVGPPGSGKSPLGDRLEAEGLGGSRCCHFDFGAELRRAAVGGPRGALTAVDVATVRGALGSGALLEDGQFHIASALLRGHLAERAVGPGDLVVLNGLPRHVGQARDVAALVDVVAVVELRCTRACALARIRGNADGDRAGRADDGAHAVRRRLATYAERTRPLLDHYRRQGVRALALDVGADTQARDLWERLEREWLPAPDTRASGGQAPRPQLQMRWPEPLLDSPPTPKLPPGYRLRCYADGDLAGYIELMARAGFGGWTAERVAAMLDRVLPDGFFVVDHVATGRVVATAVAEDRPRPGHPCGGEMGWVAADPDHRGRGLGRAVCAAATARLLAAGYRDVYLLTDDWRFPAIRTYLRLGYVPVLAGQAIANRWRAVGEQLARPGVGQGARPEDG